MIQPQTCLIVADNSGAKKVMCIRILGKEPRCGRVGDIVIGAVKEAIPGLNVKKSEVVRGVIVRTKSPIRRNDGSWLRFDDNALVILTKENNPRGTRIFGPIARELKNKGFLKISSLASEII